MICNGLSSFLHYLDDLFFCSPQDSTRCQEALRIAVPLCSQLGLPVAPHKVEGPCSVLTFLGFEIDSCKQEYDYQKRNLYAYQITNRGMVSETQCH